MAGAPKGPLLREIKPHIFFDDQVIQIIFSSFSKIHSRLQMFKVAWNSDFQLLMCLGVLPMNQ